MICAVELLASWLSFKFRIYISIYLCIYNRHTVPLFTRRHQSLSQPRINQILDNCGLDAAFKLDDAPEPKSEPVPAPCAGLISSLRVGGDYTLLVHFLFAFSA